MVMISPQMTTTNSAPLDKIAPTTKDFIWLADLYAQTEVQDARATIEALTHLGIECRVISGGLLPAVQPFAMSLGIPPDRVHAVPYPVDDPDPAAIATAHPLARNGGKPEVIASVCANGPERSRRMIVGDGTSDLEARTETGLFVGFGGVETRDKVREGADVFLESPGLSAVAGIVLTVALVALGMGVRVANLRTLGGRPLALGLLAWVLVAGTAAVGTQLAT